LSQILLSEGQLQLLARIRLQVIVARTQLLAPVAHTAPQAPATHTEIETLTARIGPQAVH